MSNFKEFDLVAALKMRDEGLSAALIAMEMSRICGYAITRNMVISRLNRSDRKNGIKFNNSMANKTKLSNSRKFSRGIKTVVRPAQIRTEYGWRTVYRQVALPVEPVVIEPAVMELVENPAPKKEGIDLMALMPESCRYIIQERPTLYCGETIDRRSYCSHHLAICVTTK